MRRAPRLHTRGPRQTHRHGRTDVGYRLAGRPGSGKRNPANGLTLVINYDNISTLETGGDGMDLKTTTSNGYIVSTVKLSYSMPDQGDYETMVFPTDDDGEVTDWSGRDSRKHYYTKEDAECGHEDMVRTVESL